MLEAQQSLDAFAAGVSDTRRRGSSTVGELGEGESLRRLPALAFPAQIVVERVASRSALIMFETNRYSVPPGLRRPAPRTTRARWRAAPALTTAGLKVATHRRAPIGARQTPEHAEQLQSAVLDAFTTQTACRRKTNRPPGDGALAELDKLHGHADAQQATVVSLQDYAALAEVTCR